MSILINSGRKLLEYFLVHPTKELHVRGLSRKLGISPPWVVKLAEGLMKENLLIIKKSKETNLKLIKADRENEKFKSIKRAFNLYSLYWSGFVNDIVKSYKKPECIVLFGSYSRGEDTEKSDIDICVINGERAKKNWDIYEKKLNRKIKIIELKKNRIEKEFKNTLANGIVLYGYLDLIQ
jgi:predicted nucleotidyltransferase